MVRSKIVLVAGEGGHNAQMLRLKALLEEQGLNVKCICEQKAKSNADIEVFFPNKISKYSKEKKIALLWLSMLQLFFVSLILFLKDRPKGVVFHGPLFCIPVFFACYILRIKCVGVESWSKFAKQSKTIGFLYRRGVRVYYQNITMKSFYEDGIYSGRL